MITQLSPNDNVADMYMMVTLSLGDNLLTLRVRHETH